MAAVDVIAMLGIIGSLLIVVADVGSGTEAARHDASPPSPIGLVLFLAMPLVIVRRILHHSGRVATCSGQYRPTS